MEGLKVKAGRKVGNLKLISFLFVKFLDDLILFQIALADLRPLFFNVRHILFVDFLLLLNLFLIPLELSYNDSHQVL